MSTMTAQATQVYSIFIKASPEQIWEAITTPEFTHRYFYGTHVTVVADAYRSVDGENNAMIEGSVSEYEPPRRLVHPGSPSSIPSRRPSRPAASPGRSSRKRAATHG
jgi:uncharacterized protein YndB with AHSA1/START domain